LRRDSRGTDWEPLVRDLTDVRRRLATLMYREAAPAAAPAHLKVQRELTERERELARRVAEHSRRADRAWRWVETAEVRKALPAAAALVEIARFEEFDFREKDWKRQWRPARYAAWIVHGKGAAGLGGAPLRGGAQALRGGGDGVQVVDLGEAAAIDRE